jgi:hypothetical protein
MAVNNVFGSLAPSRGGLAEALGFKPNPFLNFVGDNRSALLGLAAGLAGGSNWGEGLSNGFQMAAQGGMMDREAAEKLKADAKAEAALNQTSEWIKANYPQYANLPPSEGFKLAMEAEQAKLSAVPGGSLKPIEVNGQLVDPLTFEVLGDYRSLGDKQSPRASVGQPVYMRSRTDPNVWGSFAPMTDGTLINQLTGETANANDWIVDPAASTGAKAGATVDAKTAANARAALPGAKVQLDTTLKAIDKLTSNQKGLDEWFSQWGALPRGMYVQGGSEMGNWLTDFSQAEGQSFLQARQFLKGQGAITELESAKAEQAYSAMTTARQMGDKQKFLEAAADFRAAVEVGYRKIEETAAGGYTSPTPYSPSMGGNSGNGWKVVGVE